MTQAPRSTPARRLRFRPGRRAAKGRPRVWELDALVRCYQRCMDEGDALTLADVAAAVECYGLAIAIKEEIYGEASRFSIPLPLSGSWQDDLTVIRAFIDGGGWQ